MGYHRAGFEVVGIDNRPQPRYPFEFIQDDAMDWLARAIAERMLSTTAGWSFDAVHASPPCQRWAVSTPDPARHPDLITPLRPLLEATGLPYVIENVPLAPLRNQPGSAERRWGYGYAGTATSRRHFR